MPTDLEELFQKIRDTVEPRYATNSSELLQILNAALTPLTLLTMWLADEETSIDIDVRRTPLITRDNIIATMNRRLNSWTRGLLEVSSTNNRIDFLHRTVRDWILRPNIWADIAAKTSLGFDPNAALCKAAVAEFPKESPQTSTRAVFLAEVMLCMVYASRAKDTPMNVSNLVRILDKLDSKAAERAELQNESGVHHVYIGITAYPLSH